VTPHAKGTSVTEGRTHNDDLEFDGVAADESGLTP
jgi:hypothetical protein